MTTTTVTALPRAAAQGLATARSALGLLRRPFWARALLLVVALSLLFVALGRWQWGRYEGKAARNHRIDTNYGATPVPLTRLLPDAAAALPPDQEWRPVVVAGRYLPAATFLVRNVPLENVFGYDVIVPLQTDSGTLLLVDRGWLPNGSHAAEPDSLPAPPDGRVEVLARLRPSEPHLDRGYVRGQVFSIDVPQMSARLGVPTFTAYAVLARETPAPRTSPTVPPYPDEDLGPHQAYAIQWWGFAVTAYLLLGYYLVKEVHAQRPPDAPEVATIAALLWRPPRRSELSDEEWEDASDR